FKYISGLILFQLTSECSPRNPEDFCSFLVVAAGLIQSAENQLAFHLVETCNDGARLQRDLLLSQRYVLWLDFVSRPHDRSANHGIAQSPYVARPREATKFVQCGRGDTHTIVVLLAQEELGKHGNVFRPVAQGWHLNVNLA